MSPRGLGSCKYGAECGRVLACDCDCCLDVHECECEDELDDYPDGLDDGTSQEHDRG